MRTIDASKFKTQCLAILDEVCENGEEVLILKRGKPVARLLAPVPTADTKFHQESLRGTVEIHGDIVGPVVPAEEWAALGGDLP